MGSSSVAAAAKPIRSQPLWQRVDENRVKLVTFITLFLVGSALLLDVAMIVVPGSLLSLVFASDTAVWFRDLAFWAAGVFFLLLLVGAFICAVQLANSEDWVRNRLKGRLAEKTEYPQVVSAMNDMAIAAGVAASPSLVVIDSPAVNAYALGSAAKPTIGVTKGFVDQLSADEQRAVIAALMARIVAGDIMFGTALAALMGPLKAIRESRASAAGVAQGCADTGCSDPGCTDSCSGCGDIGDIGDVDSGCLGLVGLALFLIAVTAVTYVAVVSAAWIVTLWGRALHRTAYEKADAEGMLLLKDPSAMLSALRRTVESSNEFGVDDASYDGILYASSSGRMGVDARERRRFERLRQVLGTDGLATPPA